MHNFVTETKWCIVGYETGALWDLWDGIVGPLIGKWIFCAIVKPCQIYLQIFRWLSKIKFVQVCNTLHWRHNDHDVVSNHQPHGCLLNRLFRRRSKKTSKLRVTCLCGGNSPGPVNSPHKGPVTRKMFPFDDVIMIFIAVMSQMTAELTVSSTAW